MRNFMKEDNQQKDPIKETIDQDHFNKVVREDWKNSHQQKGSIREEFEKWYGSPSYTSFPPTGEVIASWWLERCIPIIPEVQVKCDKQGCHKITKVGDSILSEPISSEEAGLWQENHD